MSNSEVVARESVNSMQYVKEGLSSRRDILIDGTQAFFLNNFLTAETELRRAQRENQVISQTPRYIMDTVGMISIAFLSLFLSRGSGDIMELMPTLAAIALCLQRLIPALQQLFQSWSTIQGNAGALSLVLELLEEQAPVYRINTSPAVSFEREIRFSRVAFKYNKKNKLILEDFNFEAPKTKDFINVLKALGIDANKSLIVLGDSNNNVYLSSRNLKQSEVVTSSEISTYKILNAKSIVLTESSIAGIETNLI